MTLNGQPPNLDELLLHLCAILHSIPVLEARGYRPPIIDASGDGCGYNGDPISGLRIFKDAVSREVEILEQFLARPDHGSDLSTNAPYFVAVWNEILSAPPPIVAVGKIFDPPSSSGSGKKAKNLARGVSGSPGGIKVDVVADEGRHWIRVNTMKNARLLAEFREFDSYLTGSDDSGEDEEHEKFTPPTDEDNSLLRMGRALAAASTTPIAGTSARPRVTLRLTRLQPAPSDGATDPRIAQTIESLQGMGIDVQLGERAFWSLHDDADERRSWTPPEPTRQINMDLSMLIALVSDLSHAALPESEEAAWARFRMPADARSWKLGKTLAGADTESRTRAANPSPAPDDEEHSKHSRALSMQCIQEMAHGLITEVGERVRRDGDVEFWTTDEAHERCLQIVDKIGGADEKRRARALFPADAADIARCREEFWRGSRYPPSFLPTLLPIRIHPSHPSPSQASSLFWGHLIQTCYRILSQDTAPHPRLYRKDGEMARAQVTRANTKLTVHTVESLRVGACAGMTTLTANKASVKALLREMKQGRDEGAGAAVLGIQDGAEGEGAGGDAVAAAIWIVEPRSLAEGMRADRLST